MSAAGAAGQPSTSAGRAAGAWLPRERLVTALRGGQPDRVPMFDFLCSQDLIEHVTGHRPETYDIRYIMACSDGLQMDGAFIPYGGFKGYTAAIVRDDGDTYVDEWGTTYRRTGDSWPVDAPIAYPICKPADLRGRRLPDPTLPERLGPIHTALDLAGGRVAVLGGLNGPLTIAFTMAGWNTLAYALYDNPAFVQDLFQIGMEYDLEGVRRMAEAGVDAILLAEDMGFNTGTFFSPAHFRKYLFPYIARILDEARRYNLPVMLHCDGQINAVLDDLVEMGVNGLNPVERKAGMDIQALKHKYGSRLCLVGNVDATQTLTWGTPADVRREVLELLATVAPGGAFVLCSDSDLRDGMPVANILTIGDTAREHGRYA